MRRPIAPPRPSDLCREDVGLLLALKAGLSGKRGVDFRKAMNRFRAQVELVNSRWTPAQIASVQRNPRALAIQYADRYADHSLKASRMRAWAARLPTREDF